MNLFRKAVASVALATLVVSTTATGVSAYTAQDVAAANGLAAANVINDHSADPAKYELARTIMRGEAAKVAVNLDKNLYPKTTCENEFQDVTATTPNTWVCGYAEALLDAWKVSANTNFNPLRNISKSEAVKMMLDAAGCTDFYSDVNKWQEQTVAFASANGIAPSFTDYNTPATRAFVFSVAYNAMNTCPIEQAEEECNEALAALGLCELANIDDADDQANTSDDQANTSDELVVLLNPETPVDGLAPANTDRVPLLVFDVKAGSEDVTLENVTLNFIGLGDYKNLDNVSIYNSIGEKVSKTKDFTEIEREISFDNDIVVEAGKTMTFTVAGRLSTDGADNATYGVKIVDLETSSNVSGIEDLVGALLVPAEFSNVAAIEIDASKQSGDISVGEVEKLVEFDVEEKNDNEDVIIKSITIHTTGTADEDDLSNLEVYIDGNKVDTTLTVNDDEEIVMALDYTLAADDKVTVVVKGSITGSVGDTVDFAFEGNDDVYAIGATSGMPVAVTNEDISEEDLSDARDIEGADINVSFDKSDIDEAKPDAEDVLVGTLKISTDTADYEVKKLEVTVENTSNTGTIDSIVNDIKLDDSSYDSVSNENTTKAVYTFEDFDLVDGELVLPITVDVEDDTTLNGTDLEFTVKFIEIEDNEQDITYTDGGTNDVTDVLSSNSFDSKTISIETASLTINAVEVNERELVLGNGVETVVYKAKINVGDSDSVTINDFKLEDASTLSNGADLKDIIDSATLNIGGFTFDGDVNSNDIDFNSINAEIAAGSDNVEVLATVVLKDSDKINNNDTLKLTAVLDTGDVEDSAGDDLVGDNLDIDNLNIHPVITTLLDKGTFTIKIKNDPDTDDNLENTVLAGTSNVTLAEIELEAEYEDAKVKEIAFDFGYGDFSNTLDNVKIVNVDNGSTIVDGGIVTLDSNGHTIVTFKNDFIVADADNLIDAEIVSDLNRITGEGDETSAKAGTIKLEAVSAEASDIKWVQSNDELTAGGVLDNTAAEEVTIVPTILRFAVIETLDNGSAKVKITADSGDNTVGTNDQTPEVKLTELVFAELGNNADGYKLYKDGQASDQTAYVAPVDGKVTFNNFADVDVTFDTDATYVIVPKGTVDSTYTLILSGDVATYDVQDNDGNVVTAGLDSVLNSDISVGSKSY